MLLWCLSISIKKKVHYRKNNIIGNKSVGTFKLRGRRKQDVDASDNPFNDGKFDEDNYEKDKDSHYC